MAFVGFFSLKLALFFSFGYLFGTFLLGPDLDTKSSSYHRWGVFRFMWEPYRKTFLHRSIFTHLPVVGDIIRIVYLGCWFVLLIILPSYVIETYIPLEQIQMKSYVRLEYIVGVIVLVLIVIISFKSSPTENRKNKHRKYIIASKWIAALFVGVVASNVSTDFHLLSELKTLHLRNQIGVWFIPLGIVLSSMVHILSDVMMSSVKELRK